MKSLLGKVVLVTGAGKGAGRRAAELFAASEAVIAAADLTPINLDETIAKITTAGGVCKPYLVDIAKKLPVQGFLNQVLDDFGSIDILVNCAEVEPHRLVLEMDEWDWVRTLEVNLTGAFLLTQSAGRIMKEKGGGIIIHVSEPSTIAEGHSAYLASKAGMEKMVECATEELLGWNIHVHLAQTAEQALELCCG
jgi:3-oxoacyl-[acyl-carrier protein] reductase